MIPQKNYRKLGCAECVRGGALDFDFTMAFQPIVDLDTREIFAHEALVRGMEGEPAGHVFAHVNESNQYRFDQVCRTKAIELGSRLIDGPFLSINFMPLAVYRPELCIRTTLEAAETFGFPPSRIIFEFTEQERLDDIEHIRSIVDTYKEIGFLVAIDDFGAGHAGLNLLAELRADIVKIDMGLIRNIDTNPRKQTIVGGLIAMIRSLSMRVVVEGVETSDEVSALRDLGADLFQGYYFARPAFRALPVVPAALMA
ncbi:MAG: EAL domain-containing protein [Fimbriimonas sp.]